MQKFFKGNFGKHVRHLGFGEWFLLRVASSFDVSPICISDLLETWCNTCWKTQVLQGFHYLSPPHGILTPPKSTGYEEVTKRSRLEKTLHLHVDAGRQMFHWKKKNVSGMRQTCAFHPRHCASVPRHGPSQPPGPRFLGVSRWCPLRREECFRSSLHEFESLGGVSSGWNGFLAGRFIFNKKTHRKTI